MMDMAESIDEDTRRLVVAITDFLRDQLDTRMDFDPEDRDCLEIAIQCLEMTFGLEGSGYTHLRFFRPLMDIFNQVTHPVSVRDKLQADFFKDQGNAYMRRSMFPNAEESYSNAIELDKWNAIYFCNRASSRIEQMNFFEAIADCRQALMLNPDYAKAHARMGQAYALIHRPREASRCFRQALELEPNNERYINNLSVAEGQINRPEATGLFTTLLNTLFGLNPETSISQESTVTLPTSFMIITESHPATTSISESNQISEISDKSYQTDVQTNNLQSITFPDLYGVIDEGSEEQEVLRVNVETVTDRKMSSEIHDQEHNLQQSIVSEPRPCECRITGSSKDMPHDQEDISPDKNSQDEKENTNERKGKTHQRNYEEKMKRTREITESADTQLPGQIKNEIKISSKDTEYPAKDNEKGYELPENDTTEMTSNKVNGINGTRQSHLKDNNNELKKSEMKNNIKLSVLQTQNTEEKKRARNSSKSRMIGDKQDRAQNGRIYENFSLLEKYNKTTSHQSGPQSSKSTERDKKSNVMKCVEKQSKVHHSEDNKSERKDKGITKKPSREGGNVENGIVEETVEKLIEVASRSHERSKKTSIDGSIRDDVSQGINAVNDKTSSIKVKKSHQDIFKTNNKKPSIPSASDAQTSQSLPDVISKSKQPMHKQRDVSLSYSQGKKHQVKKQAEQPHSANAINSIKESFKSHLKSSIRNVKIPNIERIQQSSANVKDMQKSTEKDISNKMKSVDLHSKDFQNIDDGDTTLDHKQNIRSSSLSRKGGSSIISELDNAQREVNDGSEVREEILDRINNLLESLDSKEDAKVTIPDGFSSEKDTKLQIRKINGEVHRSRSLNLNKNKKNENISIRFNKTDPKNDERQASEGKETLDKANTENQSNEKESKIIVYELSDTKAEDKIHNQGKNKTRYLNRNLNGTKKLPNTEKYNIKLVVNDNTRKHNGLKLSTSKQEANNDSRSAGKKSTEIPCIKVENKNYFRTNDEENNISSNSCAEETKELKNKENSKNKLGNINECIQENSKTVPIDMQDNLQENIRKMSSEEKKESNSENFPSDNKAQESFESENRERN